MPDQQRRSRSDQRAESARRILRSAREEFAAHGYDKTTIRAIAARAGVDPSLVIQHHGSKTALFRSAVQLEPGTAADSHLDDVISSRVAGLPPELHALVRSMLTEPEAAATMREYLDERVTNLARTVDGHDAQTRAALAVSSILGLTIARHFLQLNAFTELADSELTQAAQAWISAGMRYAEKP